MGQSRRKRELGRGERILPGVWRLRLPLPWPGVPHVNAFAVRAGDGIVLFDTGMATENGQRHLELALAQVGSRTYGSSSAPTRTPITTGSRLQSSSAPAAICGSIPPGGTCGR